MIDVAGLRDSVIAIARQAGQAIMAVYRTDFADSVTYKSDASPVTAADYAANTSIITALRQLDPTIPIVSEESLDIPMATRQAAEAVWLVDPLDGTKDFLARNDEFTVNIALVQHERPVLGVVYAPALSLLYYAAAGGGAWKQQVDGGPVRLQITQQDRQPVVAVTRHHFNQETADWLKGFGPHTLLQAGSSLKFCYVADGQADVYPRLGPVMEWDIAAADIILREAGGRITQLGDNRPPTYNKPDLHQPPFIASASDLNL